MYEQEVLNDDAICEVLASYGGYEGLEDFVAPEGQHSVGSMDTINIDLWESVFRDDAWRTAAPILKHTGFGATHPGGSLERPVLLEAGVMPDRFQGTYVQWSCKRAGWVVLVPNRFLSELSFHTGDTPSWTQGEVIGEGVHAANGKRMVLCDLGGSDMECHLNEESVRVADGPHVRAYGSEGGHGYGWWKRQHCFSPAPDSAGVYGGAAAGVSATEILGGSASGVGSATNILGGSASADGSATEILGGSASGVGSGNGPGLTEQVAKNIDLVRSVSQLRCHKWWVKIFHLIVDQTMVNAYVTWAKQMEDLRLPVTSHLAFKIAVGKYLATEAIEARQRQHVPLAGRHRPHHPVHTLRRSKLKRGCVICGRLQKWFCTPCGHKWMCPESCYQAVHESL